MGHDPGARGPLVVLAPAKAVPEEAAQAAYQWVRDTCRQGGGCAVRQQHTLDDKGYRMTTGHCSTCRRAWWSADFSQTHRPARE